MRAETRVFKAALDQPQKTSRCSFFPPPRRTSGGSSRCAWWHVAFAKSAIGHKDATDTFDRRPTRPSAGALARQPGLRAGAHSAGEGHGDNPAPSATAERGVRGPPPCVGSSWVGASRAWRGACCGGCCGACYGRSAGHWWSGRDDVRRGAWCRCGAWCSACARCGARCGPLVHPHDRQPALLQGRPRHDELRHRRRA